VVSLGLGACGGGSDAPSRQEFAQDAERICKETEKALEGFGENVNSAEDAANAIDKVIERARKAADELADRERPEGESARPRRSSPRASSRSSRTSWCRLSRS
jgi:hypothetical protein